MYETFACLLLSNATLVFSPHAVIAKTHLPSARSAGRQQLLKAHVLEVLLRIVFCAVVRQSITGPVFARDFLEVNFSRGHLLLEPELFHLQELYFPTSTALQDALDCRRITVDLDLNVISGLRAKLRNTKNFAARGTPA